MCRNVQRNKKLSIQFYCPRMPATVRQCTHHVMVSNNEHMYAKVKTIACFIIHALIFNNSRFRVSVFKNTRKLKKYVYGRGRSNLKILLYKICTLTYMIMIYYYVREHAYYTRIE